MNAAKVTGQSKSNLALAFVVLDRERRHDMTILYAFCRVIDDIADSTEIAVQEKARELGAWRRWLREQAPSESTIAPEIRGLIAKYSLAPAMLEEIIDGVEMDLKPVRYESFEQLRLYCYRVASAVGLVSIEILGYKNPRCREYAIELGLALQMTNIIRDVGKDLRNGRIYLPIEDLKRFDYSEDDLRQQKHNNSFVQLMEFEAERAEGFFANAARFLPQEDRRSMIAAEIMGSVYRALLNRMKADRFHVFDRDYRLTSIEKASRIAAQFLRIRLNTK